MPETVTQVESSGDPLTEQFQRIRRQSVQLCAPLEIEDYGLQAMADTSPPKWHLAHTSWFFETFILKPYAPGYQPFNAAFEVLFNSYYNGIGKQFPRPQRGLLSRPTVAEVLDYREHVDRHMLDLLSQPDLPGRDDVRARTRLGLHHENQHQELFFTDLKYSLHCNPLLPAYSTWRGNWLAPQATQTLRWDSFDGGLVDIGGEPADGFCFDNELPRHKVWLAPFEIADRLVTNHEFLAFIEDGGYQNPALWLSDGWSRCQQDHWQQPLYWQKRDGHWFEFTLYGLQPLDPLRPVCHLSAYEADAFARWAGARLPTEFEWEHARSLQCGAGQFLDQGEFHPRAVSTGQYMGSVWQWTASAYLPYPGFRPADGAIGEYNGKFMSGQQVLRGGSCVSDAFHIRASYRNFFYAPDRWQFAGLRLARQGEQQ